jgi:hypothetical protein
MKNYGEKTNKNKIKNEFGLRARPGKFILSHSAI